MIPVYNMHDGPQNQSIIPFFYRLIQSYVESGAMEADELLFLDLQRKGCRTHTQWKNSTHNRKYFGGTRNPRFY